MNKRKKNSSKKKSLSSGLRVISEYSKANRKSKRQKHEPALSESRRVGKRNHKSVEMSAVQLDLRKRAAIGMNLKPSHSHRDKRRKADTHLKVTVSDVIDEESSEYMSAGMDDSSMPDVTLKCLDNSTSADAEDFSIDFYHQEQEVNEAKQNDAHKYHHVNRLSTSISDRKEYYSSKQSKHKLVKF